ncbi:hypothetical protein [Gimesia panareensis]|uniref:Uncharacterized protein n=1 Tax=Gimesia panareensis TaxID=2527978 RepID=A0A517Q2N7_9PLAN|nr:hypothetical protein [Gimesia panareensis]QDT25889.1 hypothetical protein Enr10x_11870 [Gimesia panareensis]QDU48826.1 hypothetical protein Pan110_11420 [Gimesia panareensis]
MAKFKHRLSSLLCCLSGLLLCSAGCSNESLEYTELKQINEKVTEAELKRYLKVVELLPQQKLPTFPSVYAPAPAWSHIRSLPIEDLVNSEQTNLSLLWEVERIRDQFGIRNRSLKKALRRRDMSKEQFVSYTLALGLAASRNQLREDQNLEDVIEKGNKTIHQLQLDKRPFSSLSLEERHRTLHEAMWISRVNRAEHLIQVPPENMNLVKAHWDELQKVLPPEFLKNPLDELTDILEERGIPFTFAKDDSDELLHWTSTNAIIGSDEPDQEPKQIKIQ